MIKRGIILIFLIGIFSVMLTVPVIADTLYNAYAFSGVGETNTFESGGGITHTIQIAWCGSSPEGAVKTRLYLDGGLIPLLLVNDRFNLDANYYLKIDAIKQQDFAGILTCNIAFSVFSQKDVECWDGNDCCRGKIVVLNTDNNDCGICGNKCEATEKCTWGYCTTYCGNNICEFNENCGTCSQDCGCQQGYQCENNRTCEWIREDECSTNLDCNDNDVSTADICAGNPKECTNRRIKNCQNDDGYCPTNCTSSNDSDCSIYEARVLEPEVENAETNTITTENEAVLEITNRVEKQDQNIINLFIGWILRLFG